MPVMTVNPEQEPWLHPQLPVSPFSELAVVRSPRQILAEAQDAAACLMEVVKQKKKPVLINNEQYLELDDWETVGRFHGLVAKVKWCQPIEVGDARGWEAQVALHHIPTGQEICIGEGMCLNDEEKWSSRPKYEYHYVLRSGESSATDPGADNIVWEPNPSKPGKKRPKKVKVQVGAEPVPSFQLRSMAQTRAASKAFRLALSWVVVLAGFKSTPAEEMTGYSETSGGSPEPSGNDEPEPKTPGGLTQDQLVVLQDRMKENGWMLEDGTGTPEAIAYLERLGCKQIADIVQKDYAGTMMFFGKPYRKAGAK